MALPFATSALVEPALCAVHVRPGLTGAGLAPGSAVAKLNFHVKAPLAHSLTPSEGSRRSVRKCNFRPMSCPDPHRHANLTPCGVCRWLGAGRGGVGRVGGTPRRQAGGGGVQSRGTGSQTRTLAGLNRPPRTDPGEPQGKGQISSHMSEEGQGRSGGGREQSTRTQCVTRGEGSCGSRLRGRPLI